MTIDLKSKSEAKHGARSLTYKSRAEANTDKNQQLRLLDLLDAVSSALRLDECGVWRVNGRNGHVYTWGDGETWVAYISPGSARKWKSLKQRLGFCQITQDGDEEGCLRFGPSLTTGQGKLLREVIGIRKRPSLTLETRGTRRIAFTSVIRQRGR